MRSRSAGSGVVRRLLVLAAIGAVLVGWTGASGAGAQEATSAFGTVRGSVEGRSQPLEGVRVFVEDADGEVGDAVTDASGRWEIELPGPGTYVALIDTATLPEGTASVDAPQTTFEADAGRRNVVVLTPNTTNEGTVVAGGSGASALRRLVNLSAQGLKLGVVIAVMAVGLSLIFGVTGLVNFSHGELITFGAIAAYVVNVSWGVPLLFGGVVVVALGGAVGWANDAGVWSPLRRRRSGRIGLIVVSIGLSIVVRHVYLIVFGASPRNLDDFARQRAFEIGPIALPPHDYVITALAFAVLAGVGFLLLRTRIGTAIRAVADNRALASVSGIDVDRTIRVVWILGGALAALGGLMQGLTEVVAWDMGFKLLLLVFAAVILGGIGTAFGAMVGGVVIGVVTQVSTYWIDNELKVAVALAVMAVVLLVRPHGLLGRAERVG